MGSVSYTLRDAGNQETTLTLDVLVPLEIQAESDAPSLRVSTGIPTRTSMQKDLVASAISLKVKGGTPPFEWFTPFGDLSASSEKLDDTSEILFTLPDVGGIYNVTVVDSGGQRQKIKVSTQEALKIDPERLTITHNEIRNVSVVGGESPYTVESDMGEIGAVEYFSIVGVAIFPPVRVYMERDETQAFQIAGGIGKDEDYFMTALKGGVDEHPLDMTFTYTPPQALDTVSGLSDVVTVTDSVGSQVSAVVEIIDSEGDIAGDGFFVTPSNATILKNEKRRFKAVGGKGQEIVWQCDEGEGDLSGQGEPSVSYTAPDRMVTTALSAMDLGSHEASAKIHVVSDHVLISPSQVYLKPGQQTTFKGNFGTGSYTFTWTGGGDGGRYRKRQRQRRLKPNRCIGSFHLYGTVQDRHPHHYGIR